MTLTREIIRLALPFVDEEDWEALREPLTRGWLTQGPEVEQFEAMFAAYVGIDDAVAVSSGTSALHLALLALGIGPGDEVIVPAFTWLATANAVMYCGARPVFADVDGRTYNMSARTVEPLVGPRTKAVLVVHQFGLCADVPDIRSVLPAAVPVIEDAACAAGASWDGRRAGSLGDIACFSFHPRKVMTTGEGGMITSASHQLTERARVLRNHGARGGTGRAGDAPWPHVEFEVLGYNYRMSDLHAAIGRVQLGRLDAMIDLRHEIARWYGTHLAGVEWLRLPCEPSPARHSWQAYVTRVGPTAPASRDQIAGALWDQGIETRPGTHAVPELGLYRGQVAGSWPEASALASDTLALPMHNRLNEADVERVSEALAGLQAGGEAASR